MRQGKRIASLLLALSMLGAAGMGYAVDARAADEVRGSAVYASGATYSEGLDARCEIIGYQRYVGANSGCFPARGDKVAVISPSELPSRRQVDAAKSGLAAWGFVPVEGRHVCPETRTLDELIEDLTWALNDPEIRAIFCVRGGSGASEVMDRLPLELIENAKKPIIGFSDITVYHSAWTMAGVPSIHGGMNEAFSWNPESCAEAERHMLLGEIPTYRCRTDTPCVDGTAAGVLIGGNLSTFVSVLGTAYDCTRLDKPYILFFEDCDDNLREIHRYLTILKHLGVLDNAAGFLFGEWTGLPADGEGNFGAVRGGEFESVADMIHREFLTDTDIPVAFDFPAGHARVNYPLLMGGAVKLSVSGGVYTVEMSDAELPARDTVPTAPAVTETPAQAVTNPAAPDSADSTEPKRCMNESLQWLWYYWFCLFGFAKPA